MECTRLVTINSPQMLYPEGVSETSQILLRDTYVLPELLTYEKLNVLRKARQTLVPTAFCSR
jgi:hypothetical protein